MHREHFLSCLILSGRAITSNQLTLWKQEEFLTKSFLVWKVLNKESLRQLFRLTEHTLFLHMVSFLLVLPEQANHRLPTLLPRFLKCLGQRLIWVQSMTQNSLQEVQEYTPMQNLVLSWKHLTWLVNLTLCSLSTSLIRLLQAMVMPTLRMYSLHSLIILDSLIIIWSVLSQLQAYILSPQLMIRIR